MENLSLTSKVLHRLGSFFIGTPQSLGMPADFYTDVGDRDQPFQDDIRKREVIGGKILTNVFRLGLSDGVGPIVTSMCFVAILGLSLLSGSLTKAGESIKTSYEQHETKVTQQAQESAVQALGDLTAKNCVAQVTAINALMIKHTNAQDRSPEDQALMNFASNCTAREFLAASGNPLQYHLRKFSSASLGVVGAQTCAAHVADFNTLATKDGWRSSIDLDDLTLSAFLNTCQSRGFIRTTDPNAPHPVYN